jgi:hypothetical protein
MKQPSDDRSVCQHPTNAAYNRLRYRGDIVLQIEAEFAAAWPTPLNARGYTKSKLALALSLFVTRIAADHIDDAAPAHDFALITNPFDAGLDFHGDSRRRARAGSRIHRNPA